MNMNSPATPKETIVIYLVGISSEQFQETAGYIVEFLSPREFNRRVKQAPSPLSDGTTLVRLDGWSSADWRLIEEALRVVEKWPAPLRMKTGVCLGQYSDEAMQEAMRYLKVGFSSLSTVAPGMGYCSRVGEPSMAGVCQEDFSERQIQVVQRAAKGMTNSEIGAELYISELTVKSHLHKIAKKVGNGDRAAIVAVFLRSGLIR